MDAVTEIKTRLPIDQLVSQYCQLQRKGRNFVCLCPFHNDKHPSMLVSPDKGIAYCFACNSGGDIFSFYQRIENVDFRQAIKDLAEKAGVDLPEQVHTASIPKDEKVRLRECLEAAQRFYQEALKSAKTAQEYLQKRGVPAEQIDTFGLGVAPDSFTATYDHLLKQGFSRSEVVKAGLGVQRELQEERIYDRFRNRLMFPIHDHQGQIIGFGGRTLGDDDAKYVNSAEGPLYHKSTVLFGFHLARERMRETKTILLVEGYFDVLACHRLGFTNVVAVSGTALTEQHVQLLKRSCETVVLCLDQDRAGKQAAERAFQLCSTEGVHVQAAVLSEKDPADAILSDPEGLRKTLESGAKGYFDVVLDELAGSDRSSVEGKRAVLQRLLPLLNALSTAVERTHYLAKTAALLGTTDVALQEDLARFSRPAPVRSAAAKTEASPPSEFSRVEMVLGLLLLYPRCLPTLERLIAPDDDFAFNLFTALKAHVGAGAVDINVLDLSTEHRERAAILQLYCEEQGVSDWSDMQAEREIRKSCLLANKDVIRHKQRDITQQLVDARRGGRRAEEELLNTQYQQLLKLAKMAD